MAIAAASALPAKSPPGLQQIAHEQAEREREGRNDLEIDERLHADAADLLGVLDMGDAGDDRAEDDRRDGHFDELDEAVAQRLDPVRRGDLRGQPAEQRAQRNRREHLNVKQSMERFFHAASGLNLGGKLMPAERPLVHSQSPLLRLRRRRNIG